MDDVFSLDQSTGRIFWKVGRFAGKEAWTALSKDGYRVGLYKRKQYMAHRLVWAMMTGCWPKMIDHINGDRSDNRPSNLREATHTQNMRNKKKADGTKSAYIGVSPYGEGWIARIRTGGKVQKLGVFDDEERAARAYDEASLKRDPVFGATNFGDYA